MSSTGAPLTSMKATITLSRKYLGEDPPPGPDEVVRLIVRVTPDKVNIFSV